MRVFYGTEKREEKDLRYIQKASAPAAGPCIRPVTSCTSVTAVVTNVKRTKSILLSKEKLCPYIHESLEHHGSPWKLTIANTSGGGGGGGE